MSPKLKRVTPTRNAIQVIDDAIKALREQRSRLVALLPRRRPGEINTIVKNPLTGEKYDYAKRRKVL